MFKPIRRLYDWVLSWAESPYGPIALFVLAFVESSFFPIPPDLLLIALCLGARSRALRYAALCTVGSILGGLFGYGIGHFAFDAVGQPIVDFYGVAERYDQVQGLYETHGFWVVFLAGFTPIPYKVFTIAAGVFKLSLAPFVLASTISRGARFFLVAGLLAWLGAPVKSFIDRWFNLLTLVFGLLLVGGFVVVKLLAH